MSAMSPKPKPAGKRVSTRALIIGAVVVVVVLLIAVPLVMMSTPAYLATYHALNRNYASLQGSLHKDIACRSCHADSRGAVVHQAALVGDFYANLFKKQKTPVFVTFEKPTRAECVSCHLTDWSMNVKRLAKVPHPAHLRVSSETRECVNCHKWTAHEEPYMQKHKTMPFSGVCVAYGCHVGFKPADECTSCHHSLQPGPVPWVQKHPKVVQEIGPNACLESCHDAAQCRLCHTTGKRPVFSGLQTETGLKAIEAQHVKKTWLTRHGTLALADETKCFECHVSRGECQDCHARRPAFHGSTDTWIGQHAKVSKDERRCLTCHKKSWCDECHEKFKEMR